MFNRIFIANRGEIACRIIRTCRRLGLTSVVAYSEADSRGLHVREADHVIGLGGHSAAESYLNGEKIIAAALSAGCQALHPGYGFLSENAEFARMVEEAGLAFIGPPAVAIDLLGDKLKSKELAGRIGLRTVPGVNEPFTDEPAAVKAAEIIGFPVLLKPAGGGGGKGMRIVYSSEEIPAAFEACRAESRKAFSDERIFMEKYLDRPRHVEIQILADCFGNVIHLGERECSIQRRYQKFIEETPSPAFSREMRENIGKASCRLAQVAGYVNLGTVEFLLDSEENLYFLEMNTRLQVEHPVTEMVTGIDLVELQIRIAAGEKLPLAQEEVDWKGWAIEARICAENPAKSFLPSTGMIFRYAAPRGGNIRVDSGVEAGSAISIYYDSLIAKVIALGNSRQEARINLIEALNGYHIEGVETNLTFINRILNHPAYEAGELSTDFISCHFQGDRSNIPVTREQLHIPALSATLVYHNRKELVRQSLKPIATTIGVSTRPRDWFDYVIKTDDFVFNVELRGNPGERKWHCRLDGQDYQIITPEFEFYRRRLKLEINGKIHRFILSYYGEFIFVAFRGIAQTFEIYKPREWELSAFVSQPREIKPDNILTCPVPGLVVKIVVQKGARVYRGQQLMVIESMKMEIGVAAPVDGVISEIIVNEGQAVEMGKPMIKFDL